MLGFILGPPVYWKPPVFARPRLEVLPFSLFFGWLKVRAPVRYMRII